MSATALGFVHRFVPATRPGLPPLLLLHGTGGTEDDLLPLGERLLPGAAQLSPRGQVLENGMPRFFRRLAEGVFDLDDLRRRTHELADFVDAARGTYDLGRLAPVAVGLLERRQHRGGDAAAPSRHARRRAAAPADGAARARPAAGAGRRARADQRRHGRSDRHARAERGAGRRCFAGRARRSRSTGSGAATAWRRRIWTSAASFSCG